MHADLHNDTSPAVLVASDVVVRSRSGHTILDGAQLEVRAGELIAVVGPSGAGKTTLLHALAGLRRPASGTVHHAAHGGSMGFVPQDDIVHGELTVGETVRFAARLRASSSTSAAVIDEAVDRTIASLGLTPHVDAIVASLSGGQRKRVSIATELVARPATCMLDEPTSGLDPFAAADLTATLRDLADAGTTVVFTSHNLADLDHVDRVVVVEPGGRLTFAGPTARAPEMYRMQRATRSPVERASGPAGAPLPRMETGQRRQLGVLCRRNLVLLGRNRLSAAIMAGAPIAVVAMLSILFHPGSAGADPADEATAQALAYWLAFSGFFFGLTFGLLQVCAEMPIVRRESHTLVGVGTYLASKVLVLAPVLAVVNLVMVGILVATQRLTGLSSSEFVELHLLLWIDSVTGLAIGLLASSSVTSSTQATLALPMLCFPAVLFGGAIVPVGSMTLLGRALATVTSTRWSFDAIASVVAGSEHGVGHPTLVILVLGGFAAIGTRVVLGWRVRP